MSASITRRFVAALLITPALATAQFLIDPAAATRRLSQVSPSKSLSCDVSPIKPALSFGLRLQTGYRIRLPLNQFTGPRHRLTILTRLVSAASDPVYLIDSLRVPPVPSNIGAASAEVGGGFFVGAGHYQVDWTLIDEQGRACRKSWQLDAALSRADRSVKLVMPPNTVAELSLGGSRAVSHPDPVPPVTLTILLEAAPLTGRRTARSILSPGDQSVLLGTLSALLERIPTTSVRLVAFNLAQQKELFRSDNFSLRSLHDLAEALTQLQLSQVEYRTLQSPTGHLDLLASLINGELHARPPSDTVIFLGARERFYDKLKPGSIDSSAESAPKFFFLAYQPQLAVPFSPDGPAGRGGRGGRGGGGGGIPPMAGNDGLTGGLPQDGSDTGVRPIRVSPPSEQNPFPDSVSLAVASLKGKTIPIRTPGQFGKAIELIERSH